MPENPTIPKEGEPPKPPEEEPPKPPEEELKGGRAAASTDKAEIVIGSIFWLIILGAVTYGYFAPHNRAQVLLQTSAQSPFELSGIVLFKGTAVSKGTVYLVFENPKKDRYLGSTILPVSETGEFATSGNESLVLGGSNKKPEPLRVTATFSGQQPGKKPEASTTVQGETTLYLNYPPPAGKWVTWGSSIIAALLAINLIILFTGELQTRSRARYLFLITYIMCFVSLSVPIWAIAVVSKSEHTVYMMEQAPIGLIKGTAKGVGRPQWLLNVGGAVVPAQEVPAKEETGAPPAKVVLAKEPEIAHPSSVDTPTATTSPTPQQSPTPKENIALDELRQVPGFALVRGGLAVPFFVIILATLGAGINMTKNVPDIQRDYNEKVKVIHEPKEPLWKTLFKAPAAVMPPREQVKMDPEQAIVVSEIQKELIKNYMGLISAPFLAIAVYYLLQVIATDVAEPVLVVVSFATGFISHNIITAITDFASKTLGGTKAQDGGRPKPPDGGPPKPPGGPPKPPSEPNWASGEQK